MKPNYLDIVRTVKSELVAAGVNVDKDEESRAEITFRVADRIYRRWNPDVGLLYKSPPHNNVRERAVDILCWRDGIIVDILGKGAEGPNTPLWMENSVPVDPSAWRQPFPYADTEPLPVVPPPYEPPPQNQPQPAVVIVPGVPPAPTVPAPPFPAPTPLQVPSPEPVVPAGLHAALSAIGAWLGSQGVALLLSWWTKRQAAPPPVGTTGSAIPRPPTATRKPPI